MPLETADIQTLFTALQNLQPNQSPAQANATGIKLPSFWQGNPEVWFRQVESVFAARNPAITSQETKFEYVIQALDNCITEPVQNIILDPPENPYDAMKTVLIRVFGKTQEEKAQTFLGLNGLGDRKPSELLQHMQNLNADPATLSKALFLAQQPPDMQRILATSSKTEIADLALEADRITEVTRLTQDTQVNTTETSQIPLRSGPSKPSTQMKKLPRMCKYHSTFGNQAKKCVPPCKFQTALGNVPPG